MSRLLEVLLTPDAARRVRLAEATLALLVWGSGVVACGYFAVIGVAPRLPVLVWAAFSGVGVLVFLVLMRSGWSRRLRDPSMTVPQVLFALASSAVGYALLGPARAAVFPMLMLTLVFGLFVATPRQVRWISVYAVAVFGAAMAVMAWRQPAVYPPALEFGHFLLLAMMVPGVSLVAARLARLRQRSRHQRAELAQALARLRENSTRDELTGLINRRHMESLLEQEHQRCIRNGMTFCLAVLDIDNFKPINELHGYGVGDAVLRAVAGEAQRQIRISDVLARWGGEEFLVMLSDTRASLAKSGLERLQQRIGALRILHGTAPLGVTVCAGLAEHHAGEAVEQTLERALQALREAKNQGREQLAVAP